MTERLTLQIFETLFEQLRYDDAKKFVDNKIKKVFIYYDEDFNITYVIHADTEDEATRKLITKLDFNTKLKYVFVYTGNEDDKYDHYRCQICKATLTFENTEPHLKDHREEGITKILLKISWFATSEIKTIY